MFRHALFASPMFYNHGFLVRETWIFLTTDFHGFSRIFAMRDWGGFLTTDFTDFTDFLLRETGEFF